MSRRPSAICLLLLAVAPCGESGGRSGPWCAGARRPAIGKIAATFTSPERASISVSPEGEVLFAFGGHGSFPIPWRDDHGRSSSTKVATTWLFRLAGERIETIGEVWRGEATLARGAGTPVFMGGEGITACTTSGQAPLPAAGEERDRLALAIDGTTLALARSEPTGPRALGGVDGETLSLLTLDTSAPAPAWRSVATHEIQPTAGPTGGKGRRAVSLVVAAASSSAAAFVIKSCSVGFGGDHYWSDGCSARVEAWQSHGWTSAALPAVSDADRDHYVVSVDDGVVRMAVEHGEKTRVYRLERGQLLAEGQELPGYPHALAGGRLVLMTIGGSKRGMSGFGYQLQVHELVDGRWKATTDRLDLDGSNDAAIAWHDKRIIVVAPENQPRNPATARVIVATGRRWKDIGVAKANVSPDSGSKN
jgi:hypothetical protein